MTADELAARRAGRAHPCPTQARVRRDWRVELRSHRRAKRRTCSPRGSVADAGRRHRRAARCRRSKRPRPHGLPGAAGGASRTARHDRARDRRDRMADRPAARSGGRSRALRVRGGRRDPRRAAIAQPTGLESPRSPFSTPISTSAASTAASSPSLSDPAQPASEHLTDAISASSDLSTSPASSCFRKSPPRPPTASFAGLHELAPLGHGPAPPHPFNQATTPTTRTLSS